MDEWSRVVTHWSVIRVVAISLPRGAERILMLSNDRKCCSCLFFVQWFNTNTDRLRKCHVMEIMDRKTRGLAGCSFMVWIKISGLTIGEFLSLRLLISLFQRWNARTFTKDEIRSKEYGESGRHGELAINIEESGAGVLTIGVSSQLFDNFLWKLGVFLAHVDSVTFDVWPTTVLFPLFPVDSLSLLLLPSCLKCKRWLEKNKWFTTFVLWCCWFPGSTCRLEIRWNSAAAE